MELWAAALVVVVVQSSVGCFIKYQMTALVALLFSVCLKPNVPVRRHISNIVTPKIKHLVLDSKQIRDRPVFVVGDVHGCHDELKDIVSEAKGEDRDTLFVFVGDLVNKGPKNVEVLDFLEGLGEHYAVRGNHDEVVLKELTKLNTESDYKLPPENEWMKNLTPLHVEYLQELPYTIQIPSLNAIIVHAGLIPGKPLELIDFNTFTNIRNIISEDFFDERGFVGTNSHDEGEAWAALWPGPEHVYFGHDARRKLQLFPFATGLDTACVYGGELTGMFINKSKKQIQIPAKKVYLDSTS